MDSPLKQRLIGAAVLVALAVIFLPMLVQGPAPDSGVANVPLSMPDTPRGDYQTRDLPLVLPGDAPAGGAVGLPSGRAPADATATTPSSNTGSVASGNSAAGVTPASATTPATTQPLAPDHDAPIANAPLPAVTAAGDYAVSLGAFSTQAAADAVIATLHASQLAGNRETTSSNGKPAWRVRVGPYATRAGAEAARLQVARVSNNADARVVVLDAQPTAVVTPASTPPADQKPHVAPVKTSPVPSAETATMVKPAESKPATAQATPPVAPIATASATGFAVQLAAFSKSEDANALRDKLRAAGFTSFTESVATDKGTLIRVRVGPVVTRTDADLLKAQVKSKLGLDGIVRPHP
ncbi:MAG: SPOR domain-containing protein [Luteimonas sp.]